MKADKYGINIEFNNNKGPKLFSFLLLNLKNFSKLIKINQAKIILCKKYFL